MSRRMRRDRRPHRVTRGIADRRSHTHTHTHTHTHESRDTCTSAGPRTCHAACDVTSGGQGGWAEREQRRVPLPARRRAAAHRGGPTSAYVEVISCGGSRQDDANTRISCGVRRRCGVIAAADRGGRTKGTTLIRGVRRSCAKAGDAAASDDAVTDPCSDAVAVINVS